MITRRSILSALALLPFASAALAAPKGEDLDGFVKASDAHLARVRNNSLYDIHEDRVQTCRLLYNYRYDMRGTEAVARLIEIGVLRDYVFEIFHYNGAVTFHTIWEKDVMAGLLDKLEFDSTGRYMDAVVPRFKFKAL